MLATIRMIIRDPNGNRMGVTEQAADTEDNAATCTIGLGTLPGIEDVMFMNDITVTCGDVVRSPLEGGITVENDPEGGLQTIRIRYA